MVKYNVGVLGSISSLRLEYTAYLMVKVQKKYVIFFLQCTLDTSYDISKIIHCD